LQRKQIKTKISKRRKSQKPHTITQKCPLGAKSIKGIENEKSGSQSAGRRRGKTTRGDERIEMGMGTGTGKENGKE